MMVYRKLPAKMFLLISLLSFAQAAVGQTISIGNVTISPNTTASISVNLSGMNEFGAATIDLYYNSSVIHVNSASPGFSGFGGSLVQNIDNTAGKAGLSIFATSTPGPNSPLALVSVELLATGLPGQSSNLELVVRTLSYTNGTLVAPNVNNGTATVSATETPTPTVTSTPAQTATPTSTITPVLSTITIQPGTVSVIAGNTQTFIALPKDQFGNIVSTNVLWSSSNANAGIIDAAGVFTALGAGTTIITATSGVISAQIKVSVIPKPAVVSAAYNFTNATTAQNSNVTISGVNITADNPLNNTELIDLGTGNGTLVINIAVNQTETTTGTVTSVILDAPVVSVNPALNRTANIDLNLSSSVWTQGNPQLSLQPANFLNDTMSSDAVTNATGDIDTALIALGKSASSKDLAIVIKATLSGIGTSDVVSLPVTMTVDADWYENKAGKNPDNVFLFKLNDTTGKVRDKQKPIKVSPKDAVNNTYTFTFVMEGFSTFALAGTPARPPSGGGGGGGGGGSGVISNENFTNIEKQESKDVAINMGAVAYKFTTLNTVKEIGFNARTNEGLLTARVELLKARPKLATADAPGNVYRYFNLWVGTSGYGSSTKIENAYIVFIVPDDWMKNNNMESVKLMKFNGSTWIDLKTESMGAGTYKAYTTGFSGFAIVGVEGAQATATPVFTQTPTPLLTTTETAVPTEKAAGFEAIIAIATLSAIFIWRKRR